MTSKECFNLFQAYYQEVVQYLTKAFASPFHPLSNLLSSLCDCYAATYGGVRVHPRLLKHAVDELSVIVEGLYYIIHALFPALPPAGKQVQLTLTVAVFKKLNYSSRSLGKKDQVKAYFYAITIQKYNWKDLGRHRLY